MDSISAKNTLPCVSEDVKAGTPIVKISDTCLPVLTNQMVDTTDNGSLWESVDESSIKKGTPCIKVGSRTIPLLPLATDSGIQRDIGSIKSFGEGTYGQLGIGGEAYDVYVTPRMVLGIGSCNQVAVGSTHTLFIDEDGYLWACGDNTYGQLGIGSYRSGNILFPTKISDKTWKCVAAGRRHSLAIDTDGYLWAWGSHNSGQLGVGDILQLDNVDPSDNFWYKIYPSPFKVNNWNGWEYVVACGDYSCGINNGAIYAWGNPEEHFGFGYGMYDYVTTPQWLNIYGVKVALGTEHALAIDTEGKLWVWGNGLDYKLGLGNTDYKFQPESLVDGGGSSALETLRDIRWIDIACSSMFSAAISAAGELYMWGDYKGRTPEGASSGASIPQKLESASSVKWRSIAAGYDYMLAIDENMEVWAFGNNSFGALGLGNVPYVDVFTQVDGGTYRSVASNAYAHTSMTISDDGSVICWGLNSHGQLGAGFGDITPQSKPTGVATARLFHNIAACDKHSLALDNDGYINVWGRNQWGQLGGFDPDGLSAPGLIAIPGMDGFQDIATGKKHSLALDKNYNLWVCGDNSDHQLGIALSGTEWIRTDSKAWQNIAAGDTFSLGIDTEGILWAWGDNAWGQLGVGDRSTRRVPTMVLSGNKEWKYIHAKGNKAMAIDSEGCLWTWGEAWKSETKSSYSVTKPKLIGDGSWIKAEFISFGRVLAIDTNGTMWENCVTPVFSDTQWKDIVYTNDRMYAIDTEHNLWVLDSQLLNKTLMDSGKYTKIVAGKQHCLLITA